MRKDMKSPRHSVGHKRDITPLKPNFRNKHLVVAEENHILIVTVWISKSYFATFSRPFKKFTIL